MEFGIFSNGFRPHTTAAQTYDEDIYEIVLADQLGFRDAYISEHHGEPPYINRVDTIPMPELLMAKADLYEKYAEAVGISAARRNITASRIVYVADSYDEAVADMREAVTHEISVQAERGFLTMLKNVFNLEVPNDEGAIDVLADAGMYLLGDPESVAARIEEFYDAAGGFGTFLIVTGKNWATREKRARSMTRFMEEVAPKLRHLDPGESQVAAA